MNDTQRIILIVALCAFFLIVLPLIIQFTALPPILYKGLLARGKPEKWTRNAPSSDSDAEMLRMWEIATKFREDHQDVREEVHVQTSDGLRLAGEYYDFGGERTVIITPGRPETLVYSCFYAEPYRKIGCNVLVFDPRAKGESEGYWTGLGYMERLDILAFAKWVHEEKGIDHVLLHGICVGSSASVFACVDEKTPDYIEGLCTDGVFSSMYETLWHRIHWASKLYPWPAIAYFRSKTKKLYDFDIYKNGPLVQAPKVQVKTLMLASNTDPYSVPKKTKEIYEAMGPAEKHLEWFDSCEHSHLRIAHMDQYDQAIADFFGK